MQKNELGWDELMMIEIAVIGNAEQDRVSL